MKVEAQKKAFDKAQRDAKRGQKPKAPKPPKIDPKQMTGDDYLRSTNGIPGIG